MEYEAHPEYYIHESWYFLWSSYLKRKELAHLHICTHMYLPCKYWPWLHIVFYWRRTRVHCVPGGEQVIIRISVFCNKTTGSRLVLVAVFPNMITINNVMQLIDIGWYVTVYVTFFFAFSRIPKHLSCKYNQCDFSHSVWNQLKLQETLGHRPFGYLYC